MHISQLAVLLVAAAAGPRATSGFTTAPASRAVPRLARASAPGVSVAPPAASATALAGRRRKGANKRKPGKGSANLSRPNTSSASHKAVDEAEIRSLFSLWNSALATGDSRLVAKRYADTSILLPTVSDTPRTDSAGIQDYFDAFLLKQPQGKILEGDIRIGDGWAQDAGVYEFTMGATGDVVKARYTFTYVFEQNQWKNAQHHSSVMPEGIDIATPITEDEVRGLFHLWNDALDTLDADAVTKRYAKKGVLLPTVSDVPRTDYAGIKDYFEAFLLKKPQGVILESNVMIGTNWCQDAGIYEFDLLGAKVKARYSFVYAFEDGQWKIAHHHSSQMPEEVVLMASVGSAAAAAPVAARSDAEVRGLFGLWNDVLATLDPDAVAARYSKAPCLLPTVSDVPRTDYAGIKDYFVAFLEKEPQGTILESYLTSGPDWCMDDGIYEFKFGATSDIVKARYSFIYTCLPPVLPPHLPPCLPVYLPPCLPFLPTYLHSSLHAYLLHLFMTQACHRAFS